MGFAISKEFHFSASHRLEGLHDGHPCGRMHGHNYVVEIELATKKSRVLLTRGVTLVSGTTKIDLTEGVPE